MNRYSLISLENLNVKGMVEERFGKQINDAGWATLAVCFATRLKVLVAELYLLILKAQRNSVADAERLFLKGWLTGCIIV